MDEKQTVAMEPVKDFYVDSAPVIAAQERAQLDIQISTAKAYPRSIETAKSQVLTLATCDRESAEACFYALPRGGKAIEGPSVRLAEIIAASYQNLRTGARVISIDATHVTAQGVCHDLQNNVASSVEIKRKITGKDGRRFNEDMIVVTANAACSIALRNAIFKVVPSAIFRDEFAKIRETADGDAKTLTETRKALFLHFKTTWKVDEARVLAVIQKHGIADVTMEDVRVLRGLATALKEGDTTTDEAFPVANANGDALAPGRHTLPRKGQKPQAPDAETGQKMEATEKELHDRAARCKDAIENALLDSTDEQFGAKMTEACKAVGADPEKWRDATDAQMVALAQALKLEEGS